MTLFKTVFFFFFFFYYDLGHDQNAEDEKILPQSNIHYWSRCSLTENDLTTVWKPEPQKLFENQSRKRNTPTNHSHAKPQSIPIEVNYFLWKAFMSNIKCYFVAYRLLLSHMKGLDIWSSTFPTVKHAVKIETINYRGNDKFFHVQKKQSICDKIEFLYFT